MDWLIAGLGNPGPEYAPTRHNIGFLVLERLAHKADVSFSAARLGSVASYRLKNKRLRLLKPNTYMNLSGDAVRFWLQQDKLEPRRLLVVTDDLALPFGKIRLRTEGSDGGHNGHKDIQAKLKTKSYPRLRFGIGHAYPHGHQINYVLSPWLETEKQALESRVDLAVEAIQMAVLQGMAKAMSQYNSQ